MRLLSQLRRPPEINARPSMVGLKESGDLKAHAHTVILAYQPVDRDTDKPIHDRSELIVGKQRFGPLGTVPVVFDENWLRFRSREMERSQAVDEVGSCNHPSLSSSSHVCNLHGKQWFSGKMSRGKSGSAPMLGRAAIWFLEIAAEALLLGIFIVVWMTLQDGEVDASLVKAPFIVAFAILWMFLTTGYLLTTFIGRVVGKGQHLWLYRFVAASLFFIHFEIMNYLVGGAFEQKDRFVILIAGMSITLICTFVGSLQVRRMTPAWYERFFASSKETWAGWGGAERRRVERHRNDIQR